MVPHMSRWRISMSLRAIRTWWSSRTRGRQRSGRAWRVMMEENETPPIRPRPHAAGSPNARPHEVRPGVRLRQGAYILSDSQGEPDIILIGHRARSCSVCSRAGEKLKSENVKMRVVSMPSTKTLDRQPQEYRDRVLPPSASQTSLRRSGVTSWVGKSTSA